MITASAPPPDVPAWQRGAPSRVRTPTVLQMEVTECGAACLAMVLAHCGRWVDLDELRERCGASRDGTSAGDLLKAAAGYGLRGAGFYRRRERLGELGFPLVLVWRGNHFVVLDGFDDRFAFLNDPAMGPRRVPLDEFDRDYSKVCLALRPDAGFTPGGRRPSLIRPLSRRFAPVSGELLAVVLIGVLATVPGLAVAGISKLFVDDVLVGGLLERAWPLVVALALVATLQLVMRRFQHWVLRQVGTRLVVAETARFVHHALRLPERYFLARSAPELAQRAQSNREVAALLTGTLANVGIGLVAVTVYGVAMFFVDPILAAIAVGLTLVNLVAMRASARRQRDLAELLTREQSALGQVTAYAAMSIESIKAGGLEGDLYSRWEGTAVRVGDARQRLAVVNQLAGALPATIGALVSALVLGVGAWRVIGGDLSVGSLVAFQSLVGSFTVPFATLAAFTTQVQRVHNLVRRLDDVLQERPDTACDPSAQRVEHDGGPARLGGALTLSGVRFGFKPTAPPLIDGFDLHVTPGQRIAVVGRSGCGKSTLVRLAAGLYEPWAGSVLLDGRPRRDIPRPVLSNSVAMVEQRIALFAGTVRDNLTLWDADVPDDDVVRAARDAQIHDDIVARAGGYSSWVVDGGTNWSGGQRQRFEIARALVRDPSILLLDEATSALDAATEAAIEDAIRRRGCTAVIVAHRLSTVRDADLIVVMDRGRIVEQGRHADLLASAGHYAQLVKE